jgi:hypothetical protein
MLWCDTIASIACGVLLGTTLSQLSTLRKLCAKTKQSCCNSGFKRTIAAPVAAAQYRLQRLNHISCRLYCCCGSQLATPLISNANSPMAVNCIPLLAACHSDPVITMTTSRLPRLATTESIAILKRHCLYRILFERVPHTRHARNMHRNELL